MAKKLDAEARLRAAKAAHAEVTEQIRKLGQDRATALMADDDAKAARIAGEIEQLRRLEAGHRDKVSLLQAEAKKAEAARLAKEKQGLIERIEARFLEREAIGAELADMIPKINSLFVRMIELGRTIDSAWPWPSADRQALMLFREHIVEATANELFRVTAHVRLGGGQVEHPDAGLRFPGSKPSRLELMDLPSHVTPLVDVLRAASEYGSDIMRARRTPASHDAPVVTAAAPTTPVPGNGVQTELSSLLERMATLAAIDSPSPNEEAEYAEVIKQLAMLQTETTANA
jgi:hypothetical protein